MTTVARKPFKELVAKHGKFGGRGVADVIRKYCLWLWYAPRFWRPLWLRVFNRAALGHRRAHATPLDAVQDRALQDLRRSGIAVLDCAELFSEQAWSSYRALAEERFQAPENREKIETQRGRMDRGEVETYHASLWESGVLDLSDPFLQFTLSEEVLGIVNGYLGVSARLAFVDLWCHLPKAGPDVSSQNWHRDPSDRKIVKVFLYLHDIDENNGPLEYVDGSQVHGRYGRVFPQRLPEGVYPARGAVESRVPAESVKKLTGKAGTIVICDTAGLHRGGHVREGHRYIYYSYFLTDGAFNIDTLVDKFGYETRSDDDVTLTPEADFAVDIWR